MSDMFHVISVCLTVSMVIAWNVVSESWKPGFTSVHVEIMNSTTGPQLEVVHISPSAGYIQTPGWSYHSLHPQNMDSVVRVDVPENHMAMLSIKHINLTGNRLRCDTSKVKLAVYETDMTKQVWQCTEEIIPLLMRQRIPEGVSFFVQFKCGEFQKVGFKLYFSIHEISTMLRGRPNDVWNCSVSNFADFKLHFPCDLYPQCDNKEDERDCPYFSEECGLGFITMDNHCLFQETITQKGTWRELEFICETRRGRLANFRRREDHKKFLRYLEPDVVDVWGFYRMVVGLHSTSTSLPMMYWQELQHTDNTIAFYRSTEMNNNAVAVCGSVVLHSEGKSSLDYLRLSYCSKKLGPVRVSLLCEIPRRSAARNKAPTKIQFVPINSYNSSLSLVDCPLRHFTRDLLACDFGSSCWSRGLTSCPAPLSPLPPSFTCDNGFDSVPYTLVCDLRPDCSDSSDETFCRFPPCDLPEPFYCSDRECVTRSSVCDGQKNCYNGVDEDLCSRDIRKSVRRPSFPAIVHLSHQGQFTVREMTQSQLADLSPAVCPETHFQCPDNGYCMPVFLRCNGVYDCLGREDEEGCSRSTCPGFYRCRDSQVCLHPQHLCDSIFQCPQNDDELLCDLNCPENCTCYGLSFYCRQSFHAKNFTKLRFLDGRGSGVGAADLTENVMLTYLSIAANGLTTVGELKFPNLRRLDLSDNQLTEIHWHDLSHLPYLNILSLSGNPLKVLFQTEYRSSPNGFSDFTNNPTNVMPHGNDLSHAGFNAALSSTTSYSSEPRNATSSGDFEDAYVLLSISTLDLSRVRARVLNPNFLSLLPNLHTVNMSGGGVDTLLGEGFQALRHLHTLDLRGCSLTHFPRDIFRGLEDLETVYSDNYKLCCPATLPVGFVLKNCQAPSDEISSCEALLRSNTYRIFLSGFAILSLVGNAGSFVYRVFLQKMKRFLSFDVLVAHLCVADLLMGVYLCVIGTADRLYLGNYLWEDNTWKTSVTCQIAGFVSLCSSEVSALVICLITIDRFLVLRFPFSSFHFGIRTAQVAAVGVWGVGCLLAAIPLAPGLDHWQFYSQTGICIPLPIGRSSSPGYTYSFGVMIIANFLFFLVIAMGQAFIYWSVHTNSLSSSDTTRKTRDVTIARRLITVAMSDFLCWFPIGLLGFLAATGTTVTGEAKVAMAIFVLPFNSALNPFLYTLNIVVEKRRMAAEEQIKKRLLAQFLHRGTENNITSSSPSCIT